jgi:hypothetical protein
VTKVLAIVVNEKGMRELRNSPEFAAMIDRVADRVAVNADALGATAQAQAGKGSVQVPVEYRRTSYETGAGLDDRPQSGSRVRSAVLVSHPTPTGRERGMRALLSALDAGVGL